MQVEELIAICKEIEQQFKGLTLTHSHYFARGKLQLTFTGGPPHPKLNIDLIGGLIYRTNRKQKSVANTFEKELVGWQLSQLTVVNQDRIVAIEFCKDEQKRRLIAELIPRRANLLIDHGSYTPPPLNENAPQLGPIPNVTSQDIEARADQNILEIERKKAIAHCRQRLKATKKNIEKLHLLLEEAHQWEADFHRAELLQAHFQELKKGSSSITLTDWKDETEKTIRLQPDKSPKDNIAQLFKASRKKKKSIVHLEKQLGAREADLANWENKIAQCEQATTSDELIATPPSAKPKAKQPPAKSLPYRTFKTAAGLTILAGKKAHDNDTLSLKIAKGNDWWFHLRNGPGSHVILQTPKNEEPDQESIKDALLVALVYSSAKKAGQGEITVSQAKYVSKPRGAKPGLVQLAKFKTAHATYSPTRWEALNSR